MRIAVIGSSGGMGRFFPEYFLSMGHTVTGSDVREAQIRDKGFSTAATNVEAVEGAEVVVIATPIDTTTRIAKEVSPRLAKGSWVVEMSSVKGRILKNIKPIIARRGARLISIHPLFGPSLSSTSNMKICVVDASKTALDFASSLFPDANLVSISARKHDRAMGVILSLTHLLNIAYAGTVAEHLTPEEFRRLETPTSSVQLSLAEGLLTQDPSLYSYIQVENDLSAKVASQLIEKLDELRRLVEKKDRKGFERAFARLSRRYQEESKTSLERVYEAFEARQSR